MATYDLGKVVGDAGEKGDDGSTVWNTSTAPTYANSKYTFTISNLSGKTGLQIAVNDIIFYSTYYYIVSAVNTTTVDCSTRVSIKGSDASVTIVDNLTTNDATKVLSAKQGKVLNDNKLEKTHSSYKGKNVVTNASTGTIEFEDKPTIPTKTSDLTNDGADGTNIFVSNNDSRLSDARTPSSHTHGQITNAGAITSTAVTVASGDNIVITDASDSSKIKRVANILSDHVKDGTAHTNIGSSASATQSTINSSIDTALGNKQATLVSGTNIKTVNNESLLGSGNITIQGGSNVDVVTSWEATLSDTKVPSEKLTKNSLDDKISKSSTSGLVKNDGTIDTTSYSTFSGSYNDLSNKPTIPSASTTTPSADTSSGSYGSGTSYARSNHTHPKSTLYAEATHSHDKSQITDFPSIPSKTSDLTNDGADGTNVFVANNDSRLSDSRTPTSHTHGNLTNDGKVGSNANYIVVTGTGGAITSVQKLGNITYDGKIGSTSGKPIITTTSGTLTTGSFGSTSGTFAEGNHTHSGYISTSSTTGLIKNDGTIMTSGTGSTNYAAGNHTHSGYVSATKVTSWQSTPSDSNVPSEKLVKDSLDGKLDNAISSTAVSIASNDDILITDYSDSNKVKRVANILSSQMKDPNNYPWIGTSENATQETINSMIDSGFNDVFGIISNKVSKSSTNGLLKNDGSVDTNTYLTSSAISGMLTTSDVVDNLTSTSTTAPLSAKQGKVLNGLIGQAIAYINQ